jgi:protein-tyrosine phosphatase
LYAAFEAVDQQHGGMPEYLHGAIGLSPQELAALQAHLSVESKATSSHMTCCL